VQRLDREWAKVELLTTHLKGLEAIRIAGRERPDIVLMDLRLPVMDGWEATKVLRRDPATSHLLIVAVTAHALASEMQSALDAGCDAVVAKPYDLASLAKAMASACKGGIAAFDVPGVSVNPRGTRRSDALNGRRRAIRCRPFAARSAREPTSGARRIQ
jgi:CheY-like chemotaxis protein